MKDADTAAMFQIVQTKDGAISGRTEVVGIGPGGAFTDQSGNLDGAVSNHDLIFKPTSVWLGGISASGSFTGDTLTISRNGTELKAKRATLAEFDQAASQIKAKAAAQQHQIAEAAAKAAAEAAEAAATASAQAAEAASLKDTADKTAKLGQAAAAFRELAAKIHQAVAAAPDYGKASAANTARLSKMAQMAPRLSAVDRGRLSIEAGQVPIGTGQIEIARTQYAFGLNQTVQSAVPAMTTIENFCASPQGAQFAQPCSDAKAAAADLRAEVTRDAAVFQGYKQAVQAELDRQNAMVQQIGG